MPTTPQTTFPSPFTSPYIKPLNDQNSSSGTPSNQPALIELLNQAVANKTKPLGALGRLEDLAIQIGLIQQTLTPTLGNPYVLVFAGDHGIAAEGVSAYPSEVTWQMVTNFLNGGAAISVFARESQLTLRVIDAGVRHDFPDHANLIKAKINFGTRNMLHEPAMTLNECVKAIESGATIIESISTQGCNVVCLGEMGIGNTSSASLLTASLLKLPLHKCVGRGTGLNDSQMKQKVHILEQVIQKYELHSPIELLATFGGYEIAMMVGALVKAAELHMVILIDGFISTAALAVATALTPHVADYCIAGHRSQEQAHGALLEWLHLLPLLNLGMRLGEGTGAALAYPLVRAAVAFLNDMASFKSANVATAC
jgi:nicotinate-nucleotide--dimethylbenzimidazole phosphoribosyltransferase